MQNYNIKSHKRGDSWLGIGQIAINVNGSPMNLTGSIIRMQLKRTSESNEFVLKWSTDDNTIEITEALEGKFKIKGRVIDIPARTYYYDIEINKVTSLDLPDDRRIITVLGGTWEIIQDVTR